MTDSSPASSPAVRRRGLGRGLDALLGAAADEVPAGMASSTSLVELDPAALEPNPEQPRRRFDESAIEELASSIRVHGLLHPIVVEPTPTGHRLVAGEMRLRAARRAGLPSIPAVVRPASQSSRHALELALTENLARAQLTPIEEAIAFARLADTFGLSHEAVAERVGRSRPTVTNTIRLLALAAPVQQALMEGRLTSGHARPLLALPDARRQEAVAAEVEERGLSARETEELVHRLVEERGDGGARRRPSRRREEPPARDEEVRRGLETALGVPVHLQRRRRGGRVVIDFHSDEDLAGLYDRLGGPAL